MLFIILMQIYPCGDMSKKRASISDHLFNAGLLTVLLVVLSLPGGPLRTWFSKWRTHNHLANLAEENWDELAATGARMDTAEVRPATIIEFGNYTCAFCQRDHPLLKALVEARPDITVGIRHYTVSTGHPMAEGAARAAICAESQGRFKEMHSLLFESDDWQDTGNWRLLAEKVDVPDLAEFERCLGGAAVERRLEEDARLAEALEVTATPTFFYAFGAHVGYLDADQLAELVESIR